jgi:hypothetical protein
LALEEYANTHPCKLSCAWHSLHHRIHWQETIDLKRLTFSTQKSSKHHDFHRQLKKPSALQLSQWDFKDALQISAAVTSNADHILTVMPAGSETRFRPFSYRFPFHHRSENE